MHCATCGTDNPAGRKFCGGCGTPLARACASCGAANEPRFAFCGECGSQLEDSTAGAPPRAVGVPRQERPTGTALSTLDDDGPAGAAAAARPERRLVSVLFADLVGFTALS